MENKTKKKLLTSTNIPLTLRPQRWVGVGRSTTHDSTEEDEGRGSSRVLPPKVGADTVTVRTWGGGDQELCPTDDPRVMAGRVGKGAKCASQTSFQNPRVLCTLSRPSPSCLQTRVHCPGQNLLSLGTELGGSIDMHGRVE